MTVLVMSSCRKVIGTGPVITEVRSTTGFTTIAMSLSGNVYYRQDSVYKVELQAQQNILNIIETSVKNNELLLKFKNNVYVRRHEDIVVTISAPSVEAFRISGSCDFRTSGDLTPANCKLVISGSGSITVPKLVTNNLEATISGSGGIRISGGSVTHQDLRISGSGSMDHAELAAKTSKTSTSGSGTMKVYTSDRLEAHISGSGNVYYRGTPVVSASNSGSGKVKPL